MRPTLSGWALSLILIAAPIGCRSTHRIDFVPIHSRIVSDSGIEGEEKSDGDRVRISWRVYGWYGTAEEEGKDIGPEFMVSMTCNNGAGVPFVLEQESLRILDDEGRSFFPDITEADRATALECGPDSTTTFQVPFRPEQEVVLERVASIRIGWAYRLGTRRREMETKFFRESVAPQSRVGTSIGFYFPFVFIPP